MAGQTFILQLTHNDSFSEVLHILIYSARGNGKWQRESDAREEDSGASGRGCAGGDGDADEGL